MGAWSRRAAWVLVLMACGRTAPYRYTELNAVDGGLPGLVEEPPPSRLPDGGTCIQSPAARASAWEQHLGEEPFCWNKIFSRNGDVGEYAFATIPGEQDSKWTPHAVDTISFDQRSTLCGPPDKCPCRGGGDFTYFQTSFELAAPAKSLTVSLRDVDDGAEVTLFNDKNPTGFVAGHFFIGSRTLNQIPDFGAQSVVGHNRLVITHVDDCCQIRRIAYARVLLDGTPLEPCQ
jgi:hypothetical protein